jgi:hypothetical protein
VDEAGLRKVCQLSSGGNTTILSSLSCAAVGYCAGVGSYSAGRPGPSFERAFVANEVNGKRHAALEVPGLSRLVKDFPGAFLSQVSCGSRRSCAAVGGYGVNLDGNGYNAFVVTEVEGIWRAAIRVPGLTPLDKGHFAELNSVSCASANSCAAGGGSAVIGGSFKALLVERSAT